MSEKPKSENCFDVYEEYTKTGEEIRVYRADAMDLYIDSLRMETVEKVVDDFTRWRKCDPVTGAPGTDYFRLKPKMVLVKVKFSVLGNDFDVVKIASWKSADGRWMFKGNEDPMNERDSDGSFKVAGWKPIV